MNWAQISRELLRALRGKRSQGAFSRRLGYRTNVASAWEAGRRFPTAAVVLRAAAIALRVDVRAKLGSLFPSPPAWLADLDPASPEGVAALLTELHGRTPIVDLARRSGRGRFAIARWLSGGAEPRLPDFLCMVETMSLQLLDFLALFVVPSKLPSVAEAWEQLQARRKASHDLPWATAVIHTLELEQYGALERHEPGWIAQRIGIPRAEEDKCLEVLASIGQIRWDGVRWAVQHGLTVDTRKDADAERRLKAWWAKVGLDRLNAGAASRDLFSFNVFNVSEADFERLRELHQNYFRALRSIVSASTPSERVVVANVQLFSLTR